jgi:MFS family permease
MASSFAIGYMLAVPVLTSLTDRRDARIILLIGSALSALATLCFGLFASGLFSASLIWGLAGIGFAGAYMPGLKALTDRLGRGHLAKRNALHCNVLFRSGPFVSHCASCGRCPGLARGILSDCAHRLMATADSGR